MGSLPPCQHASATEVVTAYFAHKKRRPTGHHLHDLARIVTWLQAELEVALGPEKALELATHVVEKHARYYGVIRIRADEVMLHAVLELEQNVRSLTFPRNVHRTSG